MGNSRARAVYEANVPDNFRRPQTDSALESFIRAKYEQKKYIAKEWIPTPTPKVDWEKEMEEELEKQKKKKKTTTTNSAAPVPIPAPVTTEKKPSTPSSSKPTSIPPPLAKPSNGKFNSPRTNRGERKSSGSSASSDLLGLNTTTTAEPKPTSTDNGENFANFLSTSPASATKTASIENNVTNTEKPKSLDQEEADFFNQTPADKEKAAKLTKDSILALYGSAPTIPTINPLNNFQNFNGFGTAVPQSMTQLSGINVGFPAQPTQTFIPVNTVPAATVFPVANHQFLAQNTIVSQQQQPSQPFITQPPLPNQWMIPNPLMAPGIQATPTNNLFNYQPTSLPTVAPTAAPVQIPDPLAKQFGSLNLNNVWQ